MSRDCVPFPFEIAFVVALSIFSDSYVILIFGGVMTQAGSVMDK